LAKEKPSENSEQAFDLMGADWYIGKKNKQAYLRLSLFLLLMQYGLILRMKANWCPCLKINF
jgi:ABC-type microcin C transport system permease subunit YejE